MSKSPYKSPYETFSCTGYVLDKVVEEITRGYASGGSVNFLQNLSGGIGNASAVLYANSYFNPSAFAHPIEIVVKNAYERRDDIISILDVRPFTKDSRDNSLIVSNPVEYKLATLRLKLHAIWNSGDAYLLQNFLSPTSSIFSAWISESISKRMDVDAITQASIAIISGWWFWCQTSTPEEIEKNKSKILRSISDSTRTSYDTVEEVLDDAEYFVSIVEFCDYIKKRLSSSRLEHLDPGSLTQLTVSGWIGINAREIMAVAMEYPPYFAAIVYASLQERGLRQAQFAKLVQRFSHRPELKAFTKSIDSLVLEKE